MYSPQVWPGGAEKRFSSLEVQVTGWPWSSVETGREGMGLVCGFVVF